jgi:hypothetical protein
MDEAKVLSEQTSLKHSDKDKNPKYPDDIPSWQSEFQPIPVSIHTLEPKNRNQFKLSISLVKDSMKDTKDDSKNLIQEIESLIAKAQELVEHSDFPAFKDGDHFIPLPQLISRPKNLDEDGKQKLQDLQSLDEDSNGHFIERPIA